MTTRFNGTTKLRCEPETIMITTGEAQIPFTILVDSSIQHGQFKLDFTFGTQVQAMYQSMDSINVIVRPDLHAYIRVAQTKTMVIGGKDYSMPVFCH